MEQQKLALVTGGMGGLGTALCRRLHDAGFTVTLTYSPGNTAPEAWLAAQRDDAYRFSATVACARCRCRTGTTCCAPTSTACST